MQGQLTEPIDIMPVITDKATRQSEVLDIDQVFVLEYTVSWMSRTAHFTVGFGAVDSSGKFHASPELRQRGARITIQEPEFSEQFSDPVGNPTREIPKAKMDHVFAKLVLPACNQLVWGLADLEIKVDGKSEYKKVAGTVVETGEVIDVEPGGDGGIKP